MRLAHPWFFALLVLVPVFVWWMLRKRRASLRYSDTSFLAGAPNPGRWLRAVPVALYAASCALPLAGEDGQNERTEAIAQFERLGMSWHLQRARRGELIG